MSRVIVFDVDGTLSNPSHRQHWVQYKPKNWKAFWSNMHLDTPHQDICELTRHFHSVGCFVVICSGRPEYEEGLDLDIRNVTRNWLVNNKVSYHALFMRKAGDFRPDHLIKLELLKDIKEDYGVPHLWFDDRDRVVEAIRSAGIRVLQVAKGDF